MAAHDEPAAAHDEPAAAHDGPVAGELDDRTIVVTGAARGQGRAIAERIVRAGGRVVAGDVLGAVDDLAAGAPDAVLAGHLDVTDAASWAGLVDAGLTRFGRIDGLVNNAGVLHRAALEDETEADYERLWRVNSLGPFLGLQAVVPHLRSAGGGAIVNTISTAGLTAWPAHASYVSSKWALRGLTKVAALELADAGIRVNAILPGPVLTPMIVGDGDPAAVARVPVPPIGRPGEPADIAELVVFLLSERAAFMTGAEVTIDGGQTVGPAAAIARDRSGPPS